MPYIKKTSNYIKKTPKKLKSKSRKIEKIKTAFSKKVGSKKVFSTAYGRKTRGK